MLIAIASCLLVKRFFLIHLISDSGFVLTLSIIFLYYCIRTVCLVRLKENIVNRYRCVLFTAVPMCNKYLRMGWWWYAKWCYAFHNFQSSE